MFSCCLQARRRRSFPPNAIRQNNMFSRRYNTRPLRGNPRVNNTQWQKSPNIHSRALHPPLPAAPPGSKRFEQRAKENPADDPTANPSEVAVVVEPPCRAHHRYRHAPRRHRPCDMPYRSPKVGLMDSVESFAQSHRPTTADPIQTNLITQANTFKTHPLSDR